MPFCVRPPRQVGDTIGSYLEFNTNVSDLDAKFALTMPGGGPHQVTPGQVTDDTELALCQAQGLVDGRGKFVHDFLAKEYTRWYTSIPFDIGNTCQTAFSSSSHVDLSDTTHDWAATMLAAATFSKQSKANGATMRATPLAIWGHKLSTKALFNVAVADARLSHPNKTCCLANALYVIACAHCINRPGDNHGAFAAAQAAVCLATERSEDKSEWSAAEDEVKEWLVMAREGRFPSTQHMGFVAIAFVHSFYHLYKRTAFLPALEETLRIGGDTDTNAAIVCGLLGALHGVDGIPQEMIQKVVACDTRFSTGVGSFPKRADFLQSGRIPGLTQAMLAVAPHHLGAFAG